VRYYDQYAAYYAIISAASREYGDERDWKDKHLLRRISPLTNADRIPRPRSWITQKTIRSTRVADGTDREQVAGQGREEVWYLLAADEGTATHRRLSQPRCILRQPFAQFLMTSVGQPSYIAFGARTSTGARLTRESSRPTILTLRGGRSSAMRQCNVSLRRPLRYVANAVCQVIHMLAWEHRRFGTRRPHRRRDPVSRACNCKRR